MFVLGNVRSAGKTGDTAMKTLRKSPRWQRAFITVLHNEGKLQMEGRCGKRVLDTNCYVYVDTHGWAEGEHLDSRTIPRAVRGTISLLKGDKNNTAQRRRPSPSLTRFFPKRSVPLVHKYGRHFLTWRWQRKLCYLERQRKNRLIQHFVLHSFI